MIVKELMDYQNNKINESMKEVDREIKDVHKKYNLFYRLTMRNRLKRRIGKTYTRRVNEF